MKTIGMTVLMASALVLVAAAPAQAEATVDNVQEQRGGGSVSNAKPTAGQKRYCLVETVTGSRLPVKTCKTRKEWKAEGVDIPSDR